MLSYVFFVTLFNDVSKLSHISVVYLFPDSTYLMCLILFSQADQGYGSGRKKNQDVVKETVNSLGFAKPNDKVEKVRAKCYLWLGRHHLF